MYTHAYAPTRKANNTRQLDNGGESAARVLTGCGTQGAMDEVLLFDLDNDKFLLRPFDDRKLLPAGCAERLQNEVEFISKHFRKAHKKGRPPQLSYKDLGDVFATFFVELLAGYRSFIVVSDT